MNFEPLDIQGAFKISPNMIGDNRGAFARVFCADAFAAKGLQTNWVQMNTSISVNKGTVRGLHFQRAPHCEVKLVRCVSGKIMDFILDIRAGSPTFGVVCGVPLDARKMEMLHVPTGCAHGFQTLTENVELHYSHSEFYTPSHEEGVCILDPDLNLELPLAVSEMSERDKPHPTLKDTRPIQL